MNTSHANRINLKINNNILRDSIVLEMRNNGVAFEILEEANQAPPGWHKVTGHLVFDVKINFTRKARWVLDGHKTLDPVVSTYAGVVLRERVRITFTYAALNNMDTFAADVRNKYL